MERLEDTAGAGGLPPPAAAACATQLLAVAGLVELLASTLLAAVGQAGLDDDSTSSLASSCASVLGQAVQYVSCHFGLGGWTAAGETLRLALRGYRHCVRLAVALWERGSPLGAALLSSALSDDSVVNFVISASVPLNPARNINPRFYMGPPLGA